MWLLSLPRWVHGLMALGAAAAAFFLWLHFHDKGVIDRHEEKVGEAVATASASGSTAASEAAKETQTKVEQGNQRAKDAAAKSADPLRDGLNALPKK